MKIDLIGRVWQFALIAGVFVAAAPTNAAVNFTGAPYAQNFDTLATTGAANAWTNDTTLPGWSLLKRANPALPAPYVTAPIATYAAGTGSSSTGAIYSFGAAASTERAFGGVASGNATYWGDGTNAPFNNTPAGWIAVALVNNTAASISSFNVSFDGEQWRDAGNATPAAQTMTLEYGVGATFDATTFTAPGGTFNFTSPIFTATPAALDGNLSANRVAGLGGTISDATWGVGETLWIRWIELQDPGSDLGLAIDNFSFSTGEVVPPDNNADFNSDNVVDGKDFLIWQAGYGLTAQTGKTNGNANTDTVVDDLDFAAWAAKFGGAPAVGAAGSIPEPGTLALIGLGLLGVCGIRRGRQL